MLRLRGGVVVLRLRGSVVMLLRLRGGVPLRRGVVLRRDVGVLRRREVPALAPSNGVARFERPRSRGSSIAPTMRARRIVSGVSTAVTAAAPMSGPYALAAFGDAIFEGEVNMSAPANFNLVVTSYQHSYQNVYTSPTDVYEAQYASDITSLLPSAMSTTALYAAGDLPQDVVFSSTPPAPEVGALRLVTASS